MKIEIANWGPIQKCEYDLNKSLIVTYGENNIGKSYAMQVMYLLLKKLRYFSDFYTYMTMYYPQIDENRSEIEEIVKKFVLNDSLPVQDITEEIVSNYKKI